MSKLSFRARALDAAKPMAVFMAHELPDLPDFTIINRAVPQMPTGMEKEEETVRKLWAYWSVKMAAGSNHFRHVGKAWIAFGAKFEKKSENKKGTYHFVLHFLLHSSSWCSRKKINFSLLEKDEVAYLNLEAHQCLFTFSRNTTYNVQLLLVWLYQLQRFIRLKMLDVIADVIQETGKFPGTSSTCNVLTTCQNY